MKQLRNDSILNGKVTYQLFETQSGDCKNYSIKISSTLFDLPETSTVSDITTNIKLAEKFYGMLADCSVLPSTLHEVTEDFLAATYS